MNGYPPVDFRIGCECPACELGVLLWFTEDEHPARAAWELYWNRVWDRRADGEAFEGPCLFQYRQLRATEPTPKPTAYKIC